MAATRAGPNDWLSAALVDSDGHPAYQLNVNVVGGVGAPSNVTVVSPLGTQAIAASVAVTPATSSNWAVTAAQLPAALGSNTPANSLSVVAAGFSFANITTATTTAVKSGAGVLHTISINALGTVASTTTVYDNTAGSGTKIATINTLAGQETYLYDVAFSTGLTIVTTGTVAPDITVSYR